CDGQRPFRQSRRQRLTNHVLHHEEVDSVLMSDIVQRADVWMVQRGNGTGLPLESRSRLPVACDVRGEHLDSDLPSEPRIAGAIDLAHAAGADQGGDFIRSDPGAWADGGLEA